MLIRIYIINSTCDFWFIFQKPYTIYMLEKVVGHYSLNNSDLFYVVILQLLFSKYIFLYIFIIHVQNPVLISHQLFSQCMESFPIQYISQTITHRALINLSFHGKYFNILEYISSGPKHLLNPTWIKIVLCI